MSYRGILLYIFYEVHSSCHFHFHNTPCSVDIYHWICSSDLLNRQIHSRLRHHWSDTILPNFEHFIYSNLYRTNDSSACLTKKMLLLREQIHALFQYHFISVPIVNFWIDLLQSSLKECAFL